MEEEYNELLPYFGPQGLPPHLMRTGDYVQPTNLSTEEELNLGPTIEVQNPAMRQIRTVADTGVPFTAAALAASFGLNTLSRMNRAAQSRPRPQTADRNTAYYTHNQSYGTNLNGTGMMKKGGKYYPDGGQHDKDDLSYITPEYIDSMEKVIEERKRRHIQESIERRIETERMLDSIYKEVEDRRLNWGGPRVIEVDENGNKVIRRQNTLDSMLKKSKALKKKGGKYEKGGEFTMSMEEVQRLREQGYKVEILD